MTGPEHFRAAERILAGESHAEGVVVLDAERVAAAQVHATLALVAAVAPPAGMGEPAGEWRDVLGGTTPDGAP